VNFQAQKSPLLEPTSLAEVARGRRPSPVASGQRAKKQRPKLWFVLRCREPCSELWRSTGPEPRRGLSPSVCPEPVPRAAGMQPGLLPTRSGSSLSCWRRSPGARSRVCSSLLPVAATDCREESLRP